MKNTSVYFRENKIAYLVKSFPEHIHIPRSSILDDRRIKYTEKGDLDYYGIFRGKYISIELKETQKERFSLNSIKPHQFKRLEEISFYGGIALIIIHFIFKEDPNIIILRLNQLQQLLKNTKSRLFKYEELKNIGGYELYITHPTILNLSEILDKII